MDKELIQLVGIVPKEMLVQKLENIIFKWKNEKTEDNFLYMCSAASMLMIKGMMPNGGSFEDVNEIIDNLEILDKGYKFFNSEKS